MCLEFMVPRYFEPRNVMADEKKPQHLQAAQVLRRKRRVSGPTSGHLSLEEQLRRLEQNYQGGELDVFGVDGEDFGDEISEHHADIVGQLGIDVYELAQDVFETFAQQHLELYPTQAPMPLVSVAMEPPSQAEVVAPVLELLDDEEEEAKRLAAEAAERARHEAARIKDEREEAARLYVLRRQQERAKALEELRAHQRQEALMQAKLLEARILAEQDAQDKLIEQQRTQAKRLALKEQEALAGLMADQERRQRDESAMPPDDARRSGRAEIYITRPGPIYNTQPGTVPTMPAAHVQQLLETNPGLQYDSAPAEDPFSAQERADKLSRLTQRYFDRKADKDRERLRNMVKGSDIEREVHDVKLERLVRRAQELSESSVAHNTPPAFLAPEVPPARDAFNKAFHAFKKQFYAQALPLFEEAHLLEPQDGLYTTFYAYTLFLTDASRKEEVERLLRDVIASNKDVAVLPDAHLFLGYVLRTIPERAAKAFKHFQLAAELNPHSHEAKRALRLEQRRKERHSSLGNQLMPWFERDKK